MRAYTLTIVNVALSLNAKRKEDNLYMAFLTIIDLCDRWNYSRAGVHKLIRSPHFPKPIAKVARGRISLFEEADIIAYEQGKSWLFDEVQKKRRQHLYGLLKQAKEKPEQRNEILQHAFGNEAKPWMTKG